MVLKSYKNSLIVVIYGEILFWFIFKTLKFFSVRLAEFDKLYERHKCPDCQGAGELICPDCKGKKVKKRNKFGKLKCGKCDKQGHVECKMCYVPSEGILRI